MKEQKNWYVWAIWTLGTAVCGHATAMLADVDQLASKAVDWATANKSVYSETVCLFALDKGNMSPLELADFVQCLKMGNWEHMDSHPRWQTKVKFLGRRKVA